MSRLVAYIDGASKGNPGRASIGVLIVDEEDNKIKEFSEYIGYTTNNVAEYIALIKALIELMRFNPTSVEIYSDSELIVNQMKGRYKVKSKNIYPLYYLAKSLFKYFDSIKFHLISRSENKIADKLANMVFKSTKS